MALASVLPDLRTVARPHLEALREATGETVHLVVLSGGDIVFVDGLESGHTLRVAIRNGRRLPAHATSAGKALLAALPPDRFAALYGDADLAAVTDRTISDRQAFEAELATTRARGYATSHGESENGVGSVAVVVLDPAGYVRAALSVAMPLDRFTDEVEAQAAGLLKSAAAALGAEL
jgi:DNA-binding IclR family transcriptional regulator